MMPRCDDRGLLQVFFANLSIASLDGAGRKLHGKPFVAAPVVNSTLVNGSTPDLSPPTHVLNKHFIPAAFTSRRSFVTVASNSALSLQTNIFHSLMTSH